MKTASFAIRMLATDEVGLFRRLRREALVCEPAAFASADEDLAHYSDRQWREQLENPTFVALLEGSPVGIMMLVPRKPRKMVHRAELMSVYVRSAHRGRGVAAAILQSVAEHARALGITQLELGVSGKNLDALRFYERHRFSVVGRIPSGFLDGDVVWDEVIMMRRLSEDDL